MTSAKLLDLIRLQVREWGADRNLYPAAGTWPAGLVRWYNMATAVITEYANGDTLVARSGTATSYQIASRNIQTSDRDWWIGVGALVDRVPANHTVSATVGFASFPSGLDNTAYQPGAPAAIAGATQLQLKGKRLATGAVLGSLGQYASIIITVTNTAGQPASPIIVRGSQQWPVVIESPDEAIADALRIAPAAQAITGDTVAISAIRGGQLRGVTDTIDPGSLKAIVKGAAYEPDANAAMRPGSTVTLDGRATTAGAWVRVWTGKVVTADVDYDGAAPKVTIEAVDGVATLANVSAPVAIGTKAGGTTLSFTRRLANLMSYWRGRDWTVSDTAPSGTLPGDQLAVNDDANLLQQLLVLRDTEHGTVYLNKSGQLRAHASNSPPSIAPRYLFSDTTTDAGAMFYTQARVRYSTRSLANALKVDVNKLGLQATYGPYRNGASIGQWDESEGAVTVNDGDPATHAAYYLKLYPDPQRTIDQLTVNVTADPTPALNSELYDAARIKRHAPAGLIDVTTRVLSIEHSIVATRGRAERGRWTMTLGTRPLEKSAAVTVTAPADPSAPGTTGSAGGNQASDQLQPFASRRLNANQTVPGGGVSTSIAWDTAVEATGLTWDPVNRWFVAPKAGRYLVQAYALIQTVTGYSFLDLQVNAVSKQKAYVFHVAGNTSPRIGDVLRLAAGDHVSIAAGQTAAESVVVTGAADQRAGVAITYLGA